MVIYSLYKYIIYNTNQQVDCSPCIVVKGLIGHFSTLKWAYDDEEKELSDQREKKLNQREKKK